MLKLIYTDNGFDLKYLPQSLEEWVSTRVLLAIRSGASLSVKPSTSAFLLPIELPYVEDLVKATQTQVGEILEVSVVDRELVEVILQGTWLTSESDSEEGLFVCQLSDHTERFLYQLWQEAQLSTSMINE